MDAGVGLVWLVRHVQLQWGERVWHDGGRVLLALGVHPHGRLYLSVDVRLFILSVIQPVEA